LEGSSPHSTLKPSQPSSLLPGGALRLWLKVGGKSYV